MTCCSYYGAHGDHLGCCLDSLKKLSSQAKWPVCLEQVKQMWSTETVFVIEHAIDFISVLLWFSLDTSLTVTPVSLTHYCVVHSLPMLHFDLAKMSLASQVRHQESCSFAYRLWKKCLLTAIIFVTDCSYLLVVSFWWCILFSSLGSELLMMYFVLISWEWAFDDVFCSYLLGVSFWWCIAAF